MRSRHLTFHVVTEASGTGSPTDESWMLASGLQADLGECFSAQGSGLWLGVWDERGWGGSGVWTFGF